MTNPPVHFGQNANNNRSSHLHDQFYRRFFNFIVIPVSAEIVWEDYRFKSPFHQMMKLNEIGN